MLVELEDFLTGEAEELLLLALFDFATVGQQ
jgi:hypothetical protein